jgi:hypothetical protein
MFMKGANHPWSGEVEATAILFAKLAALLSALEEKGITIPEVIRSFAKEEVIVEELISTQFQEVKEHARRLHSKFMMGNQYAVGCGKAMLGNTNGFMIGNQITCKYNWDDENSRTLIRAGIYPSRALHPFVRVRCR